VSDNLELQKIVGQVAAAYFNNSHVTPAEIPSVITQIASSLAAVGAPAVEATADVPEQPKLTPAQIRKSISRDALISFEDNKPYKTLRRHLAVRGMTPDEYRSKWGLPNDYPMVAPAYSEARSNLAKSLGLGSRVTTTPATAKAAAPAAETNEAQPKSPARKRAPKTGRAAATRTRKTRAAGRKSGPEQAA
jgi:predicted transcriptional regulator